MPAKTRYPDCPGCAAKRRAQARWYYRNRDYRLAYNEALAKGLSLPNKRDFKLESLPKKLQELSDEELDLKAKASMPWRQE